MTILKRSQFVDDGSGTGTLVVRAHIEPKTEGGAASKVEDGTQSYASSNESVATVQKDPNDNNKLVIAWVGAGDVQIQATADADLDVGENEVKTVSGVLDLKLEEDEADSLEIVLDDVTEPA